MEYVLLGILIFVIGLVTGAALLAVVAIACSKKESGSQDNFYKEKIEQDFMRTFLRKSTLTVS